MTTNKHLEHLEDLLTLNKAWAALGFLDSISKLLAGTSDHGVVVTTKWDGAPAIFAGQDPFDGKFFVAKKSILNKSGAKVYKTEADIDADTSGDLANKLKLALAHLPRLGIKGVIQGDFLYSKEDLKIIDVDGEPHITFHPNTLVYAVPKDCEAGQRILASDFGVVWHTKYRGQSFETMSASFGEEIASDLTQDERIWSIDAICQPPEFGADSVKLDLYKLTMKVARFPSDLAEYIAARKILRQRVNAHINSKIRLGEPIYPTKEFVLGIRSAVERFYDAETSKRKSEAGINSALARKADAIGWFDKFSEDELVRFFEIYVGFIELKTLILKIFNFDSDAKTFLKTTDGLQRTDPEGYVVSDGVNAVKLVDRYNFSRANFGGAEKGWDCAERLRG